MNNLVLTGMQRRLTEQPALTTGAFADHGVRPTGMSVHQLSGGSLMEALDNALPRFNFRHRTNFAPDFSCVSTFLSAMLAEKRASVNGRPNKISYFLPEREFSWPYSVKTNDATWKKMGKRRCSGAGEVRTRRFMFPCASHCSELEAPLA